MVAVPQRSFRTRGIRCARGMKADYTRDEAGGFRFCVFDRAGEPCVACGELITRIERGTRRLYPCPRCQH